MIMAGGSGTRLWPMSRASYPKQFLTLDGSESLLQQAVRRLDAVVSSEGARTAPLLVGNEDHRFLIVDQLREIGFEPRAVLLEPVGRNTAPALALAAMEMLAAGQDPVLVVSPADQTVTDPASFTLALRQACKLAADGAVVILGVPPERPETGFGYIEAGDVAADGARRVRRFVEKPDAATAQTYLDAGNFFWNSGLFVLKASVWMAALTTFRPDIANATQQAFDARNTDGPFVRPNRQAFEAIPAESVDFAVMEKLPGSSTPLLMLPLAAGWNDLGA
ncbi:MAG: mannose-1-phosphate guanylyltransferase, partial [Methyloversatilis sp.]|nr:mannose-1-phosphate guanylyltransferase [Methyloversatilis sp.]